jgi:MFS family permease
MHWLVVSTYTTALVIGSLLMSWLNIQKNKKTISLIALSLSGIFLFATYFTIGNTILLLTTLFISSLFLSIVPPLRNSEFSEYLNRMKKDRSSAIGLSCAVGSMSYIIGPTLLGVMSDLVGYEKMFSGLGVLAFICAVAIMLRKK